MKPAAPAPPPEEAPQKRGERNEAERKLREAAALRENLRRRKAQARGRAAPPQTQD